MAKRGKNLIIGGVSFLVVVVVGFFVYKKLKKEKDRKKAEEEKLKSESSPSTPTPSTPSTSNLDQTALATDYRIWANSTEELKKKYGKNSPYDLDSTSRNPYNDNFVRSYAVGKSDYEKYKASVASASPSGSSYAITPWNKLPLTFTKSGYEQGADVIHKSLWEYTSNPISAEARNTIIGVLQKLKHGNDLVALNNAFGSRCYKRDYVIGGDMQVTCPLDKKKPLTWWISTHLSTDAIRELSAFYDGLQKSTGHSPKEAGIIS